MKFTELTIHTTHEASEIVADVLWGYTEGGVAVSDSADVAALTSGKSGVYWDYLDETLQTPQSEVLVKAFFPIDASARIADAMQEIYACRDRGAGAIDFGTLEETKREIDGDDWIEIWKKHFRPIPLGKIVVVPAWIDYRAAEGETVLLLDSNMAFGTGEHETTSMCVELSETYLGAGDAVLDVGCGSGILGIAAVKLGASRAYLTDIDPIAVESARHNAEKNGVADRIDVAQCDLLDAPFKADLILANITAEVLLRLAPSIRDHLNRGGKVILSGIIESRLDAVKAAYCSAGLVEIREEKKGEWYALVYGEKRGETTAKR